MQKIFNKSQNWERISAEGCSERLKVIGGWLVQTWSREPAGLSLTFITDPNHEWEIK